MSEATTVQQQIIRHIIDGGSRHAIHFGVQAYQRDKSLAQNGMPKVLLDLQRLSGACHGGIERGLAIEIRDGLRRLNPKLSGDGLDTQLQFAFDKLEFLVEGNLKELETYIAQNEGVRYSRLY